MKTETIQRRFGTRGRADRACGAAFPAGKMAHRGFPLSFPVLRMAPGTFFLAFPVPRMAEGTCFVPFPGSGMGCGGFAGQFRGPGMQLQTVDFSFPSSCLGTRLSAKLRFIVGAARSGPPAWERARGSRASGTGAFPSRSLGTRSARVRRGAGAAGERARGG